jgi:hypothetical protein
MMLTCEPGLHAVLRRYKAVVATNEIEAESDYDRVTRIGIPIIDHFSLYGSAVVRPKEWKIERVGSGVVLPCLATTRLGTI